MSWTILKVLVTTLFCLVSVLKDVRIALSIFLVRITFSNGSLYFIYIKLCSRFLWFGEVSAWKLALYWEFICLFVSSFCWLTILSNCWCSLLLFNIWKNSWLRLITFGLLGSHLLTDTLNLGIFWYLSGLQPDA